MLSRTWFPLVVLALLTTLVSSGRADGKQPPSPARSEVAEMEFELKKRELAFQMADLGVKEAEISLERVELLQQQAQAANNKAETERLHLDHKQAALHVEMRKLTKQAASLELEQVHSRLKRLRGTAGLTSADARTIQRELSQDPELLVIRGKREDVDKVAAVIKDMGGLKAVPPTPHEQATAIQRLLEERRDTLQQMVDSVKEQYRAGHAQMDAVLHASESLIEAELDLAKDQAERIALCERCVENVKELEAYTTTQFESGRLSHAETLAAKAARIKAEIELLRERASGE